MRFSLIFLATYSLLSGASAYDAIFTGACPRGEPVLSPETKKSVEQVILSGDRACVASVLNPVSGAQEVAAPYCPNSPTEAVDKKAEFLATEIPAVVKCLRTTLTAENVFAAWSMANGVELREPLQPAALAILFDPKMSGSLLMPATVHDDSCSPEIREALKAWENSLATLDQHNAFLDSPCQKSDGSPRSVNGRILRVLATVAMLEHENKALLDLLSNASETPGHMELTESYLGASILLGNTSATTWAGVLSHTGPLVTPEQVEKALKITLRPSNARCFHREAKK